MRYSLLNYVACPVSRTDLTCLATDEVHRPLPHVRQFAPATRVNQPGAVVGPVPGGGAATTPLGRALSAAACEPADPARSYDVAVRNGLLVSAESGRWYPIRNFIPELLPDHLRNWTADLAFLESLRPSIPPAVFDLLDKRAPTARVEDPGQKYKNAEINITDKIDDPSFFGPGYISPFNPGAPDHTMFLIRMFAFCLPLLHGDGTRKVVLDAGCGYAWTTHWMMMSGFEPIGIDISRVYLDIAIQRLGEYLPHVLVGDTENLPLKDYCLDAVLGFDAFHHIPDRPRAMREFDRTMKRGGSVVLAEPGSEHEHAHGVQDVMDKYGTLERGMDLKDVQAYARGTAFEEPREQHILKIDDRSAQNLSRKDDLRRYSYAPAHIYSTVKR